MKKATFATSLLFLVFSFTAFAQESHWKLTRIQTTMMPLAPMVRESKDLPLDNHQTRNVSWIASLEKELKITADVTLEDVPAMIPVSNNFINPDFSVKAGGHTPFAEYIVFRATADLETVSGFQKKDAYGFLERLVYNDQPKSFGYGVRITNSIPKEDFTLNLRIYVNFGGLGSSPLANERDVSYHLYYKWMGPVSVTQVSGCFSADPTAAMRTREVHLDWAEKQEAAALEQNLLYKLNLLFDCASMTDKKIFDLYADLSVIVANYATAECFPDDKGALVRDRDVHVKWAATQTRSHLQRDLQYILKDGLHCLNRSQQNSYFADLSLSMAGAGK
jgi:hypothetical protein